MDRKPERTTTRNRRAPPTIAAVQNGAPVDALETAEA
jgi:hypothetical protein